jgi:hypothetical protein
MPLTDEQTSWLETAQNKSADFAKFGAAMETKNKELEKMTADIERIQDELRQANAEMKVTWDEDQKKHFWNASKTEMDWMSGNRDTEVDTRHDLKGNFKVDPERAKQLQKLHMELVAIQTRMENVKGPDGKPVFTPKDIERELWSPLIMADIIPSNAVSDKYSQEAQVWNGACAIYRDKLQDYSKTASKYDNAKRGLKITGDTLSVMGSIVGESIKASQFDALSITTEDKRLANELKALKKGGAKLTGEETKFLDDFKLREDKALVAAQQLQAMQVTQVVLTGGLGIVGSTLEKRNPNQGWKIAEAVFDAVGNAAVASLGMVSKSIAVSNPTLAGQSSFKTSMASATSLVQYGFKVAKVVFRVNEICMATDESGRISAAQGLIKAIAGGVSDAFAAFDIQSGKDANDKDVTGDTQWSKIGALVGTAIIGASNAGFIAKHVKSSMDAGGLKNPTALIGAVGLTVVGPIILGVFEKMADASRKDVTDKKDNANDPTDTGFSTGDGVAFEETEKERKGGSSSLTGAKVTPINDLMAKSMDLLKDSSQNKENAQDLKDAVDEKKLQEQIEAAMKKLPPIDPSSLPKGMSLEDMQQKLAKQLAKEDEKAKAKSIKEFTQSLADKTTKEEFFKTIKDASDQEIEKLNKLIKESQIDPDEMENEARAKKAMAAVDKLIMEAQALNTRWQMVETMTAGGAAILVAALPVAGLAAAIQKLAMDIAILVRKTDELNKWLKNMALTLGNNSVYGPAIAGRLASATVQRRQSAVRVVFDAIGVAAESTKLADCMGVATGLSIGNTMARALTEYGFKMHKEREIDRGWNLYKKALESPGDRKKARKAMQWNSTLSKCVIAYGIVKDGDPIAKEVGRNCGLTPEVLADTKDVCAKVVSYFQTLYSEDPVVMKRIPLTKDWHPTGGLVVSIDSWLRFKAAAVNRAKPSMSEASARTPDVDRTLTVLLAHCGKDGNFEAARDKEFPPADPSKQDSVDVRSSDTYLKWLETADKALKGLVGALRSWKPLTGPCPEGTEKPWAEGVVHTGMDDIRQSLIAQAQLLMGEVGFEITATKERFKAAEALKKVQDQGAKALLGGDVDDGFEDARDDEDEFKDALDEDEFKDALDEDEFKDALDEENGKDKRKTVEDVD